MGAQPGETQRVRGYCTLCRSRCGAVYTTRDGALLDVQPDPEHPTGAALCPKGRAAPEIVRSPRRLTRPLRRTTPKSDPDPRWQAIGWEEALAETAERLGRIRAVSGPEAVAFAVASPSGSPLSDSIDWIERFIRLFGSPNICYSTEICNWHKDYAHAFTFGCGLPMPDYESAELSILWGHNPAKTWLAQSTALGRARARGAQLAVIDPRRSTSALQADHWLRVLPGTDAALALGLANQLMERGAHDTAFLRAWSNGPLLVRADTGRFLRAEDIRPGAAGYVAWDETERAPRVCDTAYATEHPERLALAGRRRIETRDGPVECLPAFERYAAAAAEWPLARTSEVTTVPERQIGAFADALGQAESVTYHSWTGVGQHTNATQTDRAIATLYALTGSFDAPGGNVILPAHPANAPTGFEQLAPEQRAKALGLREHPLGPPAHGWVNARDLCTAITTGEPYPVRAMAAFGANLLMSQPDPRRTAEALRALEFSVHLDLFPTPTAELADIVLPVNSPWEHEGIRIGFGTGQRAQEQVQLRPRMADPVGESRSDTEIVFDLAGRLGMGEEFFGGDIEAAWDHQLAPLGLTAAELRERPGGVRLPLHTRYRKYAEPAEQADCAEQAEHAEPAEGTGSGGPARVTGFDTPTRRVELYSQRLADHGYPPVPVHADPPAAPDSRYPLTLTCAKNGYFCHSQHRSLTSLRRRAPDPTVDLSPEAAAERGIRDGQWVRLATRNATIRMRARIDDGLHPSVAVAEYGWWQSAPDLGLPGYDALAGGGEEGTSANYNLLIDDEFTDPVSGSVPMRSASCEIRPAHDETDLAGRREFTVAALERESPDVLTVRLEPLDGRPLPGHRAGAHLTLHHPDAADRSYSLTGPARRTEGGGGDRDGYSVAIRHVPGGSFSGLVHERLRVGDRVAATGPDGNFAIPTDLELPVVLMATGVGITPFLGYLETLAAVGGTVPEVVLHYGNRNSEGHAFAARIAELAARLPALRVVNHYSRPLAGDRQGRTYDRPGRMSAADVSADLIERRARFYLCGTEDMLADLTDGLLARGVPRFEIFSEKFHAAAREIAVADDARHTVRFARSNREVTWRGTDGTLLDVAEREGLALPSGCRVGQCESCAVTVLSGEVAHRVEPSDGLPDRTCLTCQAIPRTDLELDA
ncbi:molybdopterin-dependent oxidoreductase [Streptomyces sp. NPDC050617]|uniref:molybdopterin-dependent oxidoreductase n=1 Tax=Streptomyces sp. NPDC050617 TaxID=3154628 RepID=UPI0034372FC8